MRTRLTDQLLQNREVGVSNQLITQSAGTGGPQARLSARVSAARAVPELAYRAVEWEDLAVRVEALEARRLA